MNSKRQTYTSYYARGLDLMKEGIVPISIALNPPRGWVGFEYKKLAPTFNILFAYKHNHDEAAYIERYRSEILDGLDVHEVMKELVHMAGANHEFALVCYESSESFCHRHIVSDWLNENGYPCVEFTARLNGHQIKTAYFDEKGFNHADH